MLTNAEAREKVEDYKHHYKLTASAICVGSETSEQDFSLWLRGKREFPPQILNRVEDSLSALANIIHDGFPFPLDFRSAKMIPLIQKYIVAHRQYLCSVETQGA